ncbi:kinase-like domain-containing protein, partial [Chytridium lagenaria]
TCRAIFYELALAIRHLHSMGISHGDLKEENVLVDATLLDPTKPSTKPAVKLCDFGHATTNSSRYRLTAYGTREMTAPELIPNFHPHRQLSTADPFACDVYALGMVLYSLLH